MMSAPPSDVSPSRQAPSRGAGPEPSSARLPKWRRGEGALAAAGLLCLHLGHVLAWQREMPYLWFPPAGIGLALVAWLGGRGVLLVVLDGLLALLHRYLVGGHAVPGGWPGLAADAWGVGLNALEALAGWWLYHHAARGTRRLVDPRSAILFVFLVPGLTAGLFALLRALPLWLIGAEAVGLGQLAVMIWISRALGIMSLAPALLVVVTPWLVRHGLAAEEMPRDPQQRGFPEPTRLLRGDVIELAGLALGAGLLGLLLVHSHGKEGSGWQLWGVALLIIVWASMRQGLRGGTLAAAAAAVVPLTLVALQGRAGQAELLLQENLLAQGGAALLVTTSVNWVRGSEARYRRVVGHIPVVLYSARVVSPAGEGRAPVADITFVSPACRDVLGCAPEELLGSYERWLAQVHPNDREIVLAALAQLGRQREPVTCEYRLAVPPLASSLSPRDEGARGGGKESGPAHFASGSSRVIAVQPAAAKDCWLRDTLVPIFGADGVLEGWDGVAADITEQRTLADDLRHTTSMFYALVANLPAGVFFVQAPGGRPILVNARARQLLGQREDPSAGLDHLPQIYGLHRPDGTPYPADELPVSLAIRRGLTTMRDDIVVHRPDGRRVPLITWAAPIDLRGQGKTHAAVWVFEDLTVLRQAERARHESEARLRAVIETMAEGLVVQNPAGIIVECNPAAGAILGLPGERLRGRSLLSPEWHYLREDGTPLPAEEHPVRISMETGRPVRNVVLGIQELRMADGGLRIDNGKSAIHHPPSAIRWVLVNAMPLPAGPGSGPHGVVTTFADITAQRQAQEILRASEEKYRGLVETLPLMVVQFDREARITYLNPATQQITGYDRSDFETTDWQTLVRPEDLPHAQALFAEALAGQTVRTEVRYRAKDGREQVGYVIAQPHHQDGEIVGVTALVVDMTRERRLEQELQRAQRLELVGRLSSGIAHDFNNLLNVILALTELAQSNLAEDHPVREDLQRIAEAGQQAAGLAGQLLAFSKQRHAARRRIDLNRVVTRTLEILRATLPPQITLEQDLGEEKLWVRADEMQLHQLLMNLCLNARDAMPHGGRLLIRTQAVHSCNGSGGTANAGWVRLTIQDTGQGMSEAVKARIFDPFFSTKEHGTGLGLAVVQQVVSSHGGEVKVWSRPGEGSRFDIYLPREPNEVKATAANRSPYPTLSSPEGERIG
ncbi:MAG TPA: PAS domain S-box protein [Gemmataceae bacterium]|nr:PAS domain S-box protein [Gemmataceae bacterium]